MSFLLAIVARPSASATGPMRMADHLAQIAISDRAFVRTDPRRMAGHFANIAISKRVHFTFYHAPVSDKREKQISYGNLNMRGIQNCYILKW